MSSADELIKEIERLSLSTEALSVVVAWQTAREEVKDLQLENMKKNREEIKLQLKNTEAKSAELARSPEYPQRIRVASVFELVRSPVYPQRIRVASVFEPLDCLFFV